MSISRRLRIASVVFASACCIIHTVDAAANHHHKISNPVNPFQSGFGFVYNEQDGGVGSALSGTYALSSGFGQLLIRYDDSGAELGRAELAIEAGTSVQQIWALPDVTDRFWAGYIHDDGYADVGVFNLADRSPVLTKRIFLSADPDEATLFLLPNNTIALIQDLGLSVRVSIFNATTGQPVFENSYASDAFVATGGVGSLATQFATLGLLPDDSGYLLTVVSAEGELAGTTLSYSNSVVIAYLNPTGAVQSTSRLQMDSGTPLIAFSSVLSDNSALVNIFEQTVDPVTFAVTSTKTHLFKFQSNGQLAWSTIFNGAMLSVSQTAGASGDLYLTGTKLTPVQGNAFASDAVVARVSSATGALLSQAGLDRGQADFLSIGGTTSNALLVAAQSSATGTSPFTTTLIKIALDLGSVSTALEYERATTFGFLTHDPADAEVLFTTFEDASKVGLISLTEDFADTLSCDLFSPVAITLTNPGVTVETPAITPAAVVVNSTDFVSESTTTTFAPTSPVTESVDICTEGPQTPVTLSATAASAIAFGETKSVDVTTGAQTDAWTATSNASWAVVQA
ncbi:MAG: hypothetical protein ACREIA_21650, partial [Opitutaceae bacterium]